MSKVQFRTKGASPNDPLFVTLFPTEDGSVTVVEPPVMAELDPINQQEIYASCITALEELIQNISYGSTQC